MYIFCVQAICDELCSKTEAIQETVRGRTAVRDEQVAKLSKLRAETSQISTDISEKDYLMLCHMETLQSLSSQTQALHKTTVDSTKNAGLLFDKMDRTRSACRLNESSIEEFARKNVEMYVCLQFYDQFLIFPYFFLLVIITCLQRVIFLCGVSELVKRRPL